MNEFKAIDPNIKKSIVFIIFAFFISWIWFFVSRFFLSPLLFPQSERLRFGLTALGVMSGPAISAILMRKVIFKEDFKDAGLKIGRPKYYLIAYLLGVGVPIFLNIIGLIFKLGTLSNWKNIFFFLIPAITYLSIGNIIFAFGEEFGWRGYLFPKLRHYGKWRAGFFTGFIWALWHWPYILSNPHEYFMSFTLFGLILFTISTTAEGAILGWLRITSGSVFVPTLKHGISNAIEYGFLTRVIQARHSEDVFLIWIRDGGIISCFIWIVLAAIFWLIDKNKNTKTNNNNKTNNKKFSEAIGKVSGV